MLSQATLGNGNPIRHKAFRQKILPFPSFPGGTYAYKQSRRRVFIECVCLWETYLFSPQAHITRGLSVSQNSRERLG